MDYSPFDLAAMQVGDPDIDRGHESLLRVLGRLKGVGSERKGHEFELILAELGKELQTHIASEESLLTALGMPDEDVRRHLRAHSDIIENLALISFLVPRKAALSHLDIFMEVQEWIVFHFLNHDLKMRPYIACKNKGSVTPAI